MGGPGPTCTPKVGVPLVYGVSWVHVDPKFGGPPHLWGAQDPHEPPPRAGGPTPIWGALDPRVPQKSGSLWFMGWPGFTWTPDFGVPPHLWGAQDPMNPPRKLGVPLLYGAPWDPMNPPQNRGVPCAPRKLGVPLLYGGPWTHVYPKSRGSPLGALSPHRPQIWGPPSFMGCPGPP